jgi:hypothetical protein
MEDNEIPMIEATESVELELTAKGSYKWTVKVRSKLIDETTLTRLETINAWLKTKYGEK